MAHLRNIFIPLSCIIAMLQVFLLVSCDDEKDFSWPDDGLPDPDYSDTINIIRSHTEGEGVPIIIMADGYTADDIANDIYRQATLRADSALFSMEPMIALTQYFDVIEVAVPSTESGIDYTEKNTAFKAYFPSQTSTTVNADSATVEKWAKRAITEIYGLYSNSEITEKYDKCQIIVLLNSSEYKGVTEMGCSTTVTDSIPEGYSISYIPTNAAIGTRDVFADLIQHEAVGHGLGKLADEYYHPSLIPPTAKVISEFQKEQKYGCLLNVSYNADGTNDSYDHSDIYNGTYLYIQAHDVDSTEFIFPLVADQRYANEDIRWYQGGYAYLTCTDELVSPTKGYACLPNFYSASRYSTMNATTNPENKTFNAVSRLAIYKRVTRAALGSDFKCDLHDAEALNTFAKFDAPSRAATSYAKASKAASVPEYLLNPDMPVLAPPIIKEISTH